MRKFNKKKLPSRHTSLGPDRAPHRSFYYAMGETEKDVSKPFVGVVSTWNEAAPCNIALMRQAQSVKKGVRASGGTPREFCTITVTDGIAMGHEGMKSSLISREVIADSAELTVRGHCYDALVGIAGCDKSLPGLMMSMVRLNVPSVFIYGGSILPGKYKGKDVTVVDVFEAVGKHSSGQMSAKELRKLEHKLVKDWMSAAKAGVIDFFDLVRGFNVGDIKRGHKYEINFLDGLLTRDKIQDRFRSYFKGKKGKPRKGDK